MRWKFFNLAAALSLLLCVAAVLLWVYPPDPGFHILRKGDGGFAVGGTVATYALFWNDGQLGIGWTRSDVWFESRLALPLWMVVLIAAAVPLWWVLRLMMQGTPRNTGLCSVCGYDLRATPEPGGPLLARCPECGTDVPTTQ